MIQSETNPTKSKSNAFIKYICRSDRPKDIMDVIFNVSNLSMWYQMHSSSTMPKQKELTKKKNQVSGLSGFLSHYYDT